MVKVQTTNRGRINTPNNPEAQRNEDIKEKHRRQKITVHFMYM